jgi:adenylate kinase
MNMRTNLTMIGAPGSGKGFYGRLLAEAWQVPIYSASAILRKSQTMPSLDLESGRLVDCSIVAQTILKFLQLQHRIESDVTHADYRGDDRLEGHQFARPKQDPTIGHPIKVQSFVMDGFPRTRRQIDLMNDTWPDHYRISTALRLDVPDEVCAQKIAGRRVCSICQQEPNSANVRTAGFVLPPTIPSVCQNQCRPAIHWTRRPDDDDMNIIIQRLSDYRHHERPIVDYYTSVNGLFSFTPYFGIKDAPQMRQSLEKWLMLRNEREKVIE